jgi:hypothetical protein
MKMVAADYARGRTVPPQDLRRPILRGAALAAAGGALFISAIVAFSGLREFYGAESREAIIEVFRAHRAELYTAWSIMAVGDLLVGVGIWLISHGVASTESGRLSSTARIAGRVSLAACIASAVIRVFPPGWFISLESLADIAESWIFQGSVFLVWIAYSTAYVSLGLVPLFYAVGAILLGGTLLSRRAPSIDSMRGDVGQGPAS